MRNSVSYAITIHALLKTATKSEETKDDKESEKLTGLRTKSATVSVPNSTQRENRNMIELTGDAKVIAFIQSALPDLNTERQATLEGTLFSLVVNFHLY